ncbi:MAG: hypothetical protein M3436_00885 [Pseudomonadota bacterium]|nr:hypothetical protein [Pseudomonadota bacterium]
MDDPKLTDEDVMQRCGFPSIDDAMEYKALHPERWEQMREPDYWPSWIRSTRETVLKTIPAIFLALVYGAGLVERLAGVAYG